MVTQPPGRRISINSDKGIEAALKRRDACKVDANAPNRLVIRRVRSYPLLSSTSKRLRH